MPDRSDRGYKRQTLKELIGGGEYSPDGYDPLAYPAGQETPGEESYSYTDASGGALDSLMGKPGKKIDMDVMSRNDDVVRQGHADYGSLKYIGKEE